MNSNNTSRKVKQEMKRTPAATGKVHESDCDDVYVCVCVFCGSQCRVWFK